MPITSSKLAGFGLLAICVTAALSSAQSRNTAKATATAAPAPGPAGSAPGQGLEGSESAAFSIESEMLTYRALESNSEAVACDVAAYVRGGSADFVHHTDQAVCSVQAPVHERAIVVVLRFAAETIENFRLWRADMATMNQLHTFATTYCPESNVAAVANRGAEVFTPAGSALLLAQNTLAMFSSQTSVSPVGGTIEDQAFVDGVSRELRSLNVEVLMPGAYTPYSLAIPDPAQSPFLNRLDKLLQDQMCLAEKVAKSDTSPSDAAIIHYINANIESYLRTLWGGPAASGLSANTGSSDNAIPGAPSNAKAGERNVGSPIVAASSPAAPLMAILSADDFASKLGIEPVTGKPRADSPWKHLLLLKALESGGTVEKTANIFGTRIRYSGGSVGTYALFSLEGDLECSGNVYAYGGSIPATKFQTELRQSQSDSARQFIFQRGGCRPILGN